MERGRKGPVASSSCGVWELGGGSEGTTGEDTGWRDVSLDNGGARDTDREGVEGRSPPQWPRQAE